jgi:hypothetical protein
MGGNLFQELPQFAITVSLVEGDFQTCQPNLCVMPFLGYVDVRRLGPIQGIEPETVPMPDQQSRHIQIAP